MWDWFNIPKFSFHIWNAENAHFNYVNFILTLFQAIKNYFCSACTYKNLSSLSQSYTEIFRNVEFFKILSLDSKLLWMPLQVYIRAFNFNIILSNFNFFKFLLDVGYNPLAYCTVKYKFGEMSNVSYCSFYIFRALSEPFLSLLWALSEPFLSSFWAPSEPFLTFYFAAITSILKVFHYMS